MKKNNFTILFILCSYFFYSNFIISSERKNNLILWGVRNNIAQLPTSFIHPKEKERRELKAEAEKQAEELYKQSFKPSPFIKIAKKNNRWRRPEPEVSRFSCNRKGETVLHVAVRTDDEEAVKEILNHTFLVNEEDLEGNSPLHVACKKGNTRIVALLLPHTDNPNRRNFALQAPLHIACENNFQDVAQLLCDDQRTEINEKNADRSTALHVVCRNNYLVLLNILLATNRQPKHALNINLCNKAGLSPLHFACMFNSLKTAERLLKLKNSIDPNMEAYDGSTPLHNAIECSNNDIVALLLTCKDINPTIQDTVVIYIPHTNNSINQPNNTPLHIACLKKNATAVKLLLTYKPQRSYESWKKVNPNTQNADSLTPLHITVTNEDIEITTLLLNIDPNEHWIDPNCGDGNTTTPLHIACYKKNPILVKLLLEHDDILPSLSFPDVPTPLHIAVANQDIETVRLFMNHKKVASVINQKHYDEDRQSHTPLDFAHQTKNNEITELLLQYGAKASEIKSSKLMTHTNITVLM